MNPALRYWRPFDDLTAKALEQLQELFLLLLSNAMLLERFRCQLPVGVPLFLRDSEAMMRGLHIAPEVDARTASERADLLDGELLNSGLGVEASAQSKTDESWIQHA